MGVETEHQPPPQVLRPLLHPSHVAVAIFDRPRKVPRLKGGAHGGVLAGRHLTTEDQGLGAAADPAVKGAHQDLPGLGRGQGLGADLPAAGLQEPVGLGPLGAIIPGDPGMRNVLSGHASLPGSGDVYAWRADVARMVE